MASRVLLAVPCRAIPCTDPIPPSRPLRMASRVLLAVLSVPLTPAHLEYDRFVETEKNVIEKTERLASLFRLPKAPTRESLIKELVSWGARQILGRGGGHLHQVASSYAFIFVYLREKKRQ